MTMRQARKKYRQALKSTPEGATPPSFRAYARWLCVGNIKPVGKLARICKS